MSCESKFDSRYIVKAELGIIWNGQKISACLCEWTKTVPFLRGRKIRHLSWKQNCQKTLPTRCLHSSLHNTWLAVFQKIAQKLVQKYPFIELKSPPAQLLNPLLAVVARFCISTASPWKKIFKTLHCASFSPGWLPYSTDTYFHGFAFFSWQI